MERIKIRDARTHNRKNNGLGLPRNKLTGITGLSRPGKSSLAFDTLYAERMPKASATMSNHCRPAHGNSCNS